MSLAPSCQLWTCLQATQYLHDHSLPLLLLLLLLLPLRMWERQAVYHHLLPAPLLLSAGKRALQARTAGLRQAQEQQQNWAVALEALL